ncbi:recombinase family protein [Streptomyces nigrescens]
MTTRAAIYVRISQDRGGAGLGIARQEEDCRALCARKGWDVIDVYPDNDVSAYSGAPRPKWQELLADINEGIVNAVVCWHVDRLTRSPRELEDVIDLADRHGLELATVIGEIDLATPTGRMIARMLGAAARHEAEHKAERQQRQRRQAAEAGKVAGGGKRPFGYEDDRITIKAARSAHRARPGPRPGLHSCLRPAPARPAPAPRAQQSAGCTQRRGTSQLGPVGSAALATSPARVPRRARPGSHSCTLRAVP